MYHLKINYLHTWNFISNQPTVICNKIDTNISHTHNFIPLTYAINKKRNIPYFIEKYFSISPHFSHMNSSPDIKQKFESLDENANKQPLGQDLNE